MNSSFPLWFSEDSGDNNSQVTTKLKPGEIKHDPMLCMFHAPCTGNVSPMRKVTSHFFGRNKKSTRAIPMDCWPLLCRVHYQRGRYGATTSSSEPRWHEIQGSLIKTQLNWMEDQIGPVTWKIQFATSLKSEISDLRDGEVEGMESDTDSADVPTKTRTHKLDTIKYCMTELRPLLGVNKTTEQLKNFWNKVFTAIESSAIDEVPAFEFLMQKSRVYNELPDRSKTKAATTSRRPSRISKSTSCHCPSVGRNSNTGHRSPNLQGRKKVECRSPRPSTENRSHIERLRNRGWAMQRRSSSQ